VTTFLVVPGSPKEAFTGGLARQAIAGGVAAGKELRPIRREMSLTFRSVRAQRPGAENDADGGLRGES